VTPVSTHDRRRERSGILLCLLSALGFAAMAVLVKLAYRADIGLVTLLATRFTLAAALFWVLALVRRRGRPSWRLVAGGLLLGLAGYSLETALFFASIQRLGVSMAELLVYAYPALVAIGAIVLGRERLALRRMVALASATAGVLLVLAGGSHAAFDGTGVLLALGAAAAYAAYVLFSDAVLGDLDPVTLAALVSTGAAVAFVAAGAVHGDLHLSFGPKGWLIIGTITLVSTVLALTAFLGGVARLGASRASILSAAEPPMTLSLAMLTFGERLGALQVAGGALVLGAVLILHLPSPASILARRRTARALRAAPCPG
jgi:drug/metabolite transporter (DMT)-like permease